MHDEQATPSAWAKGVTLIEMMITLAVLSVIVALAVPNLTPLLLQQRVSGAAEETAAFLARARQMAIAERRCVRVILASPSSLALQSLTRADCVSAPSDWSGTIAVLRADPRVRFAVETLPSDAADAGSIIFRPNGRLRGDGDLAVHDDGGRVAISHTRVKKTAEVMVMPSGRLCWRSLATSSPAPFKAPVSCPKEAL